MLLIVNGITTCRSALSDRVGIKGQLEYARAALWRVGRLLAHPVIAAQREHFLRRCLAERNAIGLCLTALNLG